MLTIQKYFYSELSISALSRSLRSKKWPSHSLDRYQNQILRSLISFQFVHFVKLFTINSLVLSFNFIKEAAPLWYHVQISILLLIILNECLVDTENGSVLAVHSYLQSLGLLLSKLGFACCSKRSDIPCIDIICSNSSTINRAKGNIQHAECRSQHSSAR